MKIIHLTTTDMSLDWLLGPQLKAFREAGHEVVGMSAPGPHVPAIEAAGVRHVPVPALTRWPTWSADVRAGWQMYRAIRRERPDILHTHNPKPGVLGRIIGRLARVPVIINTQHGLYAQTTDTLKRRVLVYGAERIAAVFGHLELVQNPEDVETLVRTLKVPARKVMLLGNGIDLSHLNGDRTARDRIRAEWGIDSDDIVAGVVGRLVREKGLHELFEALRTLKPDHPRLRLVVVGPQEPDKPDGLHPTAIAEAAELGVVFTGQRSDMPQCYAAMDIFVTATHREGFPRAAMEASASGLPLVATDIRGCRQVVENGVTGLLVPVRNAVALAAAIAELATGPQQRTRMGEAAKRKAASDFDQQRVIDITLEAYEREWSRRAPRRRR
ncbi:MAG TPA: glycosyltransferase family 4 protein [Ilumatobacteraceae bacterium]|nr:glycosyltransferase family 4 protein [Ilumatobacteraceae bacterium]